MMTDPYGQTNPRPTNGVATPAQILPVGHVTPRMLLAVAAIYNPALLIGYFLYIYGPSNSCVLGGLCGFGGFPGIIQVFLLIVGAGIFMAVVFVPLWWLLDEARPARDIVSRAARDMMRFVTIRPLMAGYGVMLALLLIVGLLVQRIPPPLFLLGFSSAVICFWCAASSEFTPTAPAPPPSQQRNRDTSGSAFLRDSPPAP
ncbi:MAG TPA: hypothetical protein VGF38_12755 [Ktedonobacterales bacterium]|jgi:hypothetical protein